MTAQAKILSLLKSQGYISNYYCIDTRLTIRLGGVIHKLKEQGLIEIDEDKSGYRVGTKDYVYYLLNKTTLF